MHTEDIKMREVLGCRPLPLFVLAFCSHRFNKGWVSSYCSLTIQCDNNLHVITLHCRVLQVTQRLFIWEYCANILPFYLRNTEKGRFQYPRGVLGQMPIQYPGTTVVL